MQLNRLAAAALLALVPHASLLPTAYPATRATAALASTDPVIIDSFDGRATISPWTFANGAEFPGASGSLLLGAGQTGNGAELRYTITCTNPNDYNTCGHYVIANLELTHSLAVSPTAVLGFWAKTSPEIQIRVRVRDTSGQTLQYGTKRSLEAAMLDGWYYVRVPLNQPEAWWGGSGNGVFGGSIAAVGVLAADPRLYPISGTLRFDTVAVHNNDRAPVTLDPAGMALNPAPTIARRLAPRLGVSVHFLYNNPVLDIIKNAGFSFVRKDMLWQYIEQSNGSYVFGGYDTLVDELAARGLGAMYIIDYGHPNHSPATTFPWRPSRAQDLTAYRNFATAAAQRYRTRNVSFEVWNEPNVAYFWGGTPDPVQFATLLQTGITAVNNVSLTIPVVTGGTSYVEVEYLKRMFRAGGARASDAVGVHLYKPNGAPEPNADDVLLLKKMISVELSPTLPIWNTEWGYSSSWGYPSGIVDGKTTANRKRQAVMTARSILTAWSLDLPKTVYYDIIDDGTSGTSPEHNFGLLDTALNDKPAMRSVRTIATDIAKNRDFMGMAPGYPSGLHVMKLTGQNDTVLAVWMETFGYSQQVRFPLAGSVVISDVLGDPVTYGGCAGTPTYCTVTVTESAGPIYITFPTLPTDIFEPNDTPQTAPDLPLGPVQTDLNLSTHSDVDWFKVKTTAGTVYTFETSGLLTGTDTVLQIIGADGVTVIASDDNGGGGQASRLVRTLPGGVHYVRVTQKSGTTGTDLRYDLRAAVARPPRVFHYPNTGRGIPSPW